MILLILVVGSAVGRSGGVGRAVVGTMVAGQQSLVVGQQAVPLHVREYLCMGVIVHC
jgi:hypothetical protein